MNEPEGRDQAAPMHLGLTHRPFVHPLKVMSSLIHLQRRHRTKRRDSHLLAKEGTIGISLSARDFYCN
jgi:hypothetical protein